MAPAGTSEMRSRHRVTALALAGIVCAMTGMAYAAVPLYDLFCRVTGYGGTTAVAERAPDSVGARIVTIRFDANVNSALDWRFEPDQREIVVRLGEEATAFYRAVNESEEPLVGSATFNVTPQKAGLYFNKIDCFCFTEQRLAAGQSIDMPVSFFVDPALADDRNLEDVKTITLSYTFFRKDSPAEAKKLSQARLPANSDANVN